VRSFQEGKGSKMSWVWLADKEEDELKFVWADIGCTIISILMINDRVKKMRTDMIENRRRVFGFN
jgi:hypothetical protein